MNLTVRQMKRIIPKAKKKNTGAVKPSRDSKIYGDLLMLFPRTTAKMCLFSVKKGTGLVCPFRVGRGVSGPFPHGRFDRTWMFQGSCDKKPGAYWVLKKGQQAVAGLTDDITPHYRQGTSNMSGGNVEQCEMCCVCSTISYHVQINVQCRSLFVF